MDETEHRAAPARGGLRRTVSGGGDRVKHSRPLLGILVLAVVAAIALPLLNTMVIYPAYTEIMVGTFEDTARRLAVHATPPSIKHTRLTPAVLDTPSFLADVYRLESSFGLLKIKVLSPEGRILYSTNPREIDQQETDPVFREQVARGIRYARLGVMRDVPSGAGPVDIDTVHAFVPLMRGDTFLGAFEIVFDVTEPKKQLERFNTYATAGTFLISFCLLIIVLILLRMEALKEHARQTAERLRSDVEHITRHDIKTPLLGVLNGITYLENYTSLDEEQQGMLDDMRRAVNTGMDLINRSLDLYKMERGSYQYAPAALDGLLVCGRVLDDLSGLARAKGVAVQATLGGGPIGRDQTLTVSAEENLLYAILANLVKNAIEASNEGDRVNIRLDAGRDFVVAVNNPAVVPQAVRDNFFSKYATAGKHTGTGLGTYSARLMVEVMGGTIAMETSEENGTTVTVTLPMQS